MSGAPTGRSGTVGHEIPAACVHFDPVDPALAEPDPATGGTSERYWSVMREMQESCPVAFSDTYEGYWILSRRDDVVRVAQDWQTFSSANGIGPVPRNTGRSDKFLMLPVEADAPFHRSLRRLMSRQFTPTAIADLETDIQAIAADLFDSFTERGSCDFVADFAAPFPGHVLFKWFIGIRPEAKVLGWVEQLVLQPQTAHDVLKEFAPWCAGILSERASRPAADDALGVLAHGLLDGERLLTSQEQLQVLVNLFVGGLETTTGALTNIARHLALDPALRERLLDVVDDDDALARACDEFLRFEAPAPAFSRTVTTDTKIKGQPIRAGTRVLISFGAANRDPDEWPHPEQIDLNRVDAGKHLSFGAGPHRCVGAPLARLELRVALREMLRRMPNLRLDSGDPLSWRSASSRGLAKLPLRFDPAS